MKKEIYLTQLQPETGREKKGWGYHDHQGTVFSTLTIGDRFVSMVRFMSELEHIKQDKQDVVSRAVAYYREALATANPFQEIVTLFSSIQAIVYDVCKDTKWKSICSVLHDFVNLDWDECDCYYHNYRSAADHGGKHILESHKMQDATTKAVSIRRITFNLIREYAERNRQEYQKQGFFVNIVKFLRILHLNRIEALVILFLSYFVLLEQSGYHIPSAITLVRSGIIRQEQDEEEKS